jgi:DeoR family transcriptional regulator of aga operon
MLYIDRRKEILELILKNGSAKVSELAQKYGVGDVTIRRDLKYLAQNYDIELTYGGALANNNIVYKSIMDVLATRRTQNLDAKRIVAKKAAGLISDGDTIALNSGSTAELVLDYLGDGIRSLNLITLSLSIAAKASTKPFIDIYLPGGQLRSFSNSFYGTDAEAFLEKFSVNKAFFGVLAVSLKDGVTHPILEDANVNRALSKIASKRYLLTDSSKFDKVSLVKMIDLDAFEIGRAHV